MKPPAKITTALKELDGIIAKGEKEYDERYGEWPSWLYEEIGGSPGTCTTTASWLARTLRGKVVGYSIEDNTVAQLGDCEGGHDFAIIDDRWLVDWWAFNTYGPGGFEGFGEKPLRISRRVYDLADSTDQRRVERLYGDPKKWEQIPLSA